MSNAGTGARIKVWPDVESSEGPLLNGGGGSGYVRNVTYQTLNSTNNDWAIQIDQLSPDTVGVMSVDPLANHDCALADVMARTTRRCASCTR